MNRFKKQVETDTMTRIAIVEKDRCKPKNCGLACKKSCPVVRMGYRFISLVIKFVFHHFAPFLVPSALSVSLAPFLTEVD